MSKISKLKKSRESWKEKAIVRGESMRYLHKENNRMKSERDYYKREAQQAKILLEKKNKNNVPSIVCKVDLIYIALQLFLEASISFRAVSRVLQVLSKVLGISKAPSHQTIINWVFRLGCQKTALSSQIYSP